MKFLPRLTSTCTLNVNSENVLELHVILSTGKVHGEFLINVSVVWNHQIEYEISVG